MIKYLASTPLPQPQTPTKYDILDQVFINSSPLDTIVLHQANQVLKTTLQSCIALNSLTTRYIQKLADETKRLNTRDIIRKRETENLRAIIKTRKERKKGKQAVLKGHFCISTEELHIAVVTAENETRARAGKKSKKKGKNISHEVVSDEDTEEET